MLIRLLPTVTTLITIARAIDLTPGTSISGTGLNVKFSGANTDSAVIVLTLYAGGDSLDSAAVVGTGTLNTPPASGSIPIKLVKGAGPPDDNAYFVQATENLAGGGSDLSYSNRFSISGMTGTFPAAGTMSAAEVEAAYKKVADDKTAVPKDSEVQGQAGGAAGNAATGDVPAYSVQTTGTMKMAPMQQKPGKKITKTDTSPLYPTSAYKTATKALSIPSFKITQTVSNTETVKSRPNTGAPAEMPTDDMGKFLNRWKD